MAEPSTEESLGPPSIRNLPSTFERVICSNPPILDSLFAQITTQDALHLYHTSRHLRTSLQHLPTAWRFISWKLPLQPITIPAPHNPNNPNNPSANQTRQSSNYALDHLLISVINPYSTCLQSLELDNTAVSGGTLSQTVLVLRRDTLQHLSVRGCKNVSLKYHINPWLNMHVLAKEGGAFPYDKLALKSLYTYRCRHHRRRPYLPQSLARKESDSEPTHELVKACHELGIWTDTAWCTTPGPRCFRRRGYVTMRSPSDPREVWVVFDRLWRSKNWLGRLDSDAPRPNLSTQRRLLPDPRLWESDEVARKGEDIGINGDGKHVPMHLRASHRIFVETYRCHQCDDPIAERCEQCSITMHCSGCRKTLCASCAFDRPYLRNRNAPEQDRNNFWWAPGSAVSPCSMQDSDDFVAPAHGPPAAQSLPALRLKWCCTEPIFSGGGGIAVNASSRGGDSIRAAPLPREQGWEEPEFSDATDPSKSNLQGSRELVGKWNSLNEFFQIHLETDDCGGPKPGQPVPRILCEECHSSSRWRVNCKSCNLPICIKHDMRDRLKARICGFRDMSKEREEYFLKIGRQQEWEIIHGRLRRVETADGREVWQRLGPPTGTTYPQSWLPSRQRTLEGRIPTPARISQPARVEASPNEVLPQPITEDVLQPRPLSRASSTSDTISRSSSPAPSIATPPVTPEPSSVVKKVAKRAVKPVLEPAWKGCYSFFCPTLRTPAGDHRRRCHVTIRQCTECKVNVCETCTGKMDESCPCRGCKTQSAEGATTPYPPMFFCTNCRWSRMVNGKCKRLTEQFLAAQAVQNGRARRAKKSSASPMLRRKRTSSGSGPTDPDSAALFLSEFSEMRISASGPSASGDGPADLNHDEQGEIEEIENVGHLARELITRIQGLRGQFRPGSLAARALPDVRLIDDSNHIILNARTESDSSSDDPSN